MARTSTIELNKRPEGFNYLKFHAIMEVVQTSKNAAGRLSMLCYVSQ
jgi:hypothetical protein